MNPIQIRTLKPGTMPKASEWNALVTKARRGQPSQAGFDWANGTSYKKKPNPFRQQTIFYTPVDIPAYSVFPVKVRTDSGEPFEVCEFDSSEIEDYLDGYFGTNGRFTIPKETSFYGWLIDEHHDDPVTVYGSPNVGDECGLSERAGFKADPETQGMIITGVFSPGVYYVRKMNYSQYSEVFGTLNEPWNGYDFDTEIEINLDSGFTVNGWTTLRALPAKVLTAPHADGDYLPNVSPGIPADTPVTCRYIKSKDGWFFFRPRYYEGTTGYCQGNVFATQGSFPTELLSGCTVNRSDINVRPVVVPITRSGDHYPWVRTPTDNGYMTIWQKKAYRGAPQLYKYGGTYNNPSREIASPDFPNGIYSGFGRYENNIYDAANSRFYRLGHGYVNGTNYFATESGAGGESSPYIYYTYKWDPVGQMYESGWTIGNALGAFLDELDPQPFCNSNSLANLMTQEGLVYGRPEWNCNASDPNTEYGIYEPNSLNSGAANQQFGSESWLATDGRTNASYPSGGFRFAMCSKYNVGVVFNIHSYGSYTNFGFGQTFKNLYHISDEDGNYCYCIGNKNLPYGVYLSRNEPSLSHAVTFDYYCFREQAGTDFKGQPGLYAELKYVNTDGFDQEHWRCKLHGIGSAYIWDTVEDMVRAEGADTMTGSIGRFQNITKSGTTWTLGAHYSGAGTCVYEGDLSYTEPNIFKYQHSITLTFDKYVQGNELTTVWACDLPVIE